MKNKYTYLVAVFLIAACAVSFGRIFGNGFVNLDDAVYITGNGHVQSGINAETIRWAFSAVVCANWHPLTMLSHALDWSLFGANASGHHLVSLLLHMGAVVLLFLFLNKMTGNIWPSAFAAAFFALHPLRVESVAWAAERKDVLSMFFGMAAIYAYAFYAEKPRPAPYLASLALFALALMSKPMLVTLPFILMLLDYWPLGRWRKDCETAGIPARDSGKSGKEKNKQPVSEKRADAPTAGRSASVSRLLWEKVPFIFLTIVSCIVTLWAQNKGGAVISIQRMPFAERVATAMISCVAYLGKIFRPFDLAVFYPFDYNFPFWKFLVFFLILAGITAAVIRAFRKMPFLFTGWFWYLGALVPVIGLVQVGEQSMADRYTYLPSIGIALGLAWGIPFFISRAGIRKRILFPAGIAVLAVLAVLTWRQCGYWRGNAELYGYALRVTQDNYFVHNVLGLSLLDQGETGEAIAHFDEVIRLRPSYIPPYCNRGIAYAKLEQYQRAVEDYNEALRLKPDYADAYNNRGVAYAGLGWHEKALEDYNEALRLKPGYAEAFNNRGIARTKLGRYELAVDDFNEAIRFQPGYADAYNNRGFAYSVSGRYQQAVDDLDRAILLKPDALAYKNRAAAYLGMGNRESGCRDARTACTMGSCDLLEAAGSRGVCP